MQALKSLFTRAQDPHAVVLPQAQPAQPTELSADSLKLVGGGLPRVGGLGSGSSVASDSTATTLPAVS